MAHLVLQYNVNKFLLWRGPGMDPHEFSQKQGFEHLSEIGSQNSNLRYLLLSPHLAYIKTIGNYIVLDSIGHNFVYYFFL